MGSPISFSGFNQIDFSVVLNAIMQQESRPLQALEAREKAIQATDTALTTLASKLDAIRTAAAALTNTSAAITYSAASSNPGVANVTAGTTSVPGSYDVVVTQLARAQVTASASTAPDSDTTIVADGGTMTINGVAVTLTGPVTLQGLASQINATASIPVSASVIETSPGAFRLVLTGTSSGVANAFTVQNGLTNTTVAFTDTDNDGLAGNTAADNAVQASDASLLINNIPVTATDNVLNTAIPGATLTLVSEAPTQTIKITVARDDESLATRLEAFVSAFNELTTFVNEQRTESGKGTPGALGHDPLLRSLRGALRSALGGLGGNGMFHHLAEIGIGFNRTGEMTFDRTALNQALSSDFAGVYSLLGDSQTGVLTALNSTITEYTRSGGLVPGARTRLTDELARLEQRIDEMQARLAVRRAALQREFMAADEAMSRLNSQSGSLASFSQNLISSGF